jgi:hypothetical protein
MAMKKKQPDPKMSPKKMMAKSDSLMMESRMKKERAKTDEDLINTFKGKTSLGLYTPSNVTGLSYYQREKMNKNMKASGLRDSVEASKLKAKTPAKPIAKKKGK